jgi:hypothetical protein
MYSWFLLPPQQQPMPLAMMKEGTHRIVKMGGKTKITASISKNTARVIFNQSQKTE